MLRVSAIILSAASSLAHAGTSYDCSSGVNHQQLGMVSDQAEGIDFSAGQEYNKILYGWKFRCAPSLEDGPGGNAFSCYAGSENSEFDVAGTHSDGQTAVLTVQDRFGGYAWVTCRPSKTSTEKESPQVN